MFTRELVMVEPEVDELAKAPFWLSSKTMEPPLPTAWKLIPVTSDQRFRASRARVWPAAVRAVRLTVSVRQDRR